MANIRLHGGQSTVFNDKRRVRVVVAGRRWGKTALAKTIIIEAAASKPRQLVWYVAPTYGMARSILWEDLKESVPKKWIVRINETRMSIKLRNGSPVKIDNSHVPQAEAAPNIVDQ